MGLVRHRFSQLEIRTKLRLLKIRASFTRSKFQNPRKQTWVARGVRSQNESAWKTKSMISAMQTSISIAVERIRSVILSKQGKLVWLSRNCSSLFKYRIECSCMEHEDEVFDSSGFYSIPVACQNHSDVDEVPFDSPVRLKSIGKQNKKRKRGKKNRNRRNRRIKSE